MGLENLIGVKGRSTRSIKIRIETLLHTIKCSFIQCCRSTRSIKIRIETKIPLNPLEQLTYVEVLDPLK